MYCQVDERWRAHGTSYVDAMHFIWDRKLNRFLAKENDDVQSRRREKLSSDGLMSRAKTMAEHGIAWETGQGLWED